MNTVEEKYIEITLKVKENQRAFAIEIYNIFMESVTKKPPKRISIDMLI